MGEKIANEATDKALISKINKQFNTREVNNPIQKWAKELNRPFSKQTFHPYEKMLNITHYERNANQNHK